MKIVLSNTLMVNGRPVRELTYDTTKITVGMFCEADAYKFEAAGNKTTISTYEFDSSLHLFLGMQAVIAENPHIDIRDLSRVSGPDLMKFVAIGRNFILDGVRESAPRMSGELSETTPEHSDVLPEN